MVLLPDTIRDGQSFGPRKFLKCCLSGSTPEEARNRRSRPKSRCEGESRLHATACLVLAVETSACSIDSNGVSGSSSQGSRLGVTGTGVRAAAGGKFRSWKSQATSKICAYQSATVKQSRRHLPSMLP